VAYAASRIGAGTSPSVERCIRACTAEVAPGKQPRGSQYVVTSADQPWRICAKVKCKEFSNLVGERSSNRETKFVTRTGTDNKDSVFHSALAKSQSCMNLF
jgi:hypothetical protein